MFHPQPQRSRQHRPQNPATDQNYTYGLPIGNLCQLYPTTIGGVDTLENKYQYNGIELEDVLGINIDMARYRTLDPQLGRWWQIDPEVEQFYAWTPYNSNLDNPVRYEDPDGDCLWCWGAVIGVASEYAEQVAGNTMKYYQGDKEVTSAYDVVWGKVDKVYLAVAGIEGAVTGGGSVVRKYAVQGSAELVKASWDYDKGGNNHIFSKTTDKTVGGVLLNASAGQAAKSTGELVELGVESSTKTALNQAKREAISIKAARGHTPSSSKVAYNDAILSVHRRTIANNSVVGKVANKMTAGQRTGAVKTVGVSISVAKTQVVSKAQTEIKKNTPKR